MKIMHTMKKNTLIALIALPALPALPALSEFP
jgi:hypothetical protein